MSRVFLADETALGRKVVVKVLPPELAAEVNVERFRREIQVAARLQHPHIVPLLRASEDGPLLYYSMPFVEGESLRDRLARDGELPIADGVRLLREVSDALSYAHEHGVVHRDIKPENILLSRGHAVVADFGVAKALAAATSEQKLTSTGLVLGTPTYMAPEQAVGDPRVDHRADLYALGVVAYEMLAGQPPFVGRSTQATVAAHVTEVPELIAKRRPAVSVPLAELVMSLLEKRAADRPQSADAVIQALDALPAASSGERTAAESGARRVDSRNRRRVAVFPVRDHVLVGEAHAREDPELSDLPPPVVVGRDGGASRDGKRQQSQEGDREPASHPHAASRTGVRSGDRRALPVSAQCTTRGDWGG